jgi:hypothetical protein
MVGHDVGALPDCSRGLHLGVEGDAPFEGRRIDLDFASVLLVELVEHHLHTGAVAAAQKIPPDNGVFGARRANTERHGRQRRVKDFADHLDFLPKMARRLPRVAALWCQTSRLLKPCKNGSEESARRQGVSISKFDTERMEQFERLS